ncbi:MAG TPA: TIGR02391 family protein [Mycobacterium sp.]|nr:TIGR02391 family protein [Mycobacterium sp.]
MPTPSALIVTGRQRIARRASSAVTVSGNAASNRRRRRRDGAHSADECRGFRRTTRAVGHRPLGRHNDEHHREAVLAASGALVHHVKQLTRMVEVDETNVGQLAFSSADPQPGRPRLRWTGDPKNQTVRSMNEGLRLYAPALQLAIRNPLAHDPTEITAQQGAERLSALSLLAQWVEACDLVHAKPGRRGGRSPRIYSARVKRFNKGILNRLALVVILTSSVGRSIGAFHEDDGYL